MFWVESAASYAGSSGFDSNFDYCLNFSFLVVEFLFEYCCMHGLVKSFGFDKILLI